MVAEREHMERLKDNAGAGCEDRTRHLMITNQVLYQLS